MAHGPAGGPLTTNTAAALDAFTAIGAAPAAALGDLAAAWRLQQDLAQLLRVAIPRDADPDLEPKALRTLMAKVGGVRGDRALRSRLVSVRRAAHAAFLAVAAAT